MNLTDEQKEILVSTYKKNGWYCVSYTSAIHKSILVLVKLGLMKRGQHRKEDAMYWLTHSGKDAARAF